MRVRVRARMWRVFFVDNLVFRIVYFSGEKK